MGSGADICNHLKLLFFFCKKKRKGIRTKDLGGEPSQLCGDRKALLEQEVVKRAAAESLQIHLMFVIPELVQGVWTGWERDREEERGMQIKNRYSLAQGQHLIANIISCQRKINNLQTVA